MGEVIHYCEVCNKQFIPYRSFHKRCSDLCRRIATEKNNYGYMKKKIVTKECLGCGVEFKTNNIKKTYHSPKCQKWHLSNTRIKKERQSRICPVCHSEFETTHWSKAYCGPDCYKKAKRGREHV